MTEQEKHIHRITNLLNMSLYECEGYNYTLAFHEKKQIIAVHDKKDGRKIIEIDISHAKHQPINIAIAVLQILKAQKTKQPLNELEQFVNEQIGFEEERKRNAIQ